MSPALRAHWPAMALGVTQIMGYGTLYYAYSVLLPHMATDLGLTLSSAFGILSLALFFGGLVSPLAGRLVDQFGGRWVMALGSLAAGLALIGMGFVTGRVSLFIAILLTETAGRCVLYSVAFASVARLDTGVPVQRSISVITLFGGVASTIFWPLTLALYNGLGWETTWIILGISVIAICVPLHLLALGGPQHDPEAASRDMPDWPELTGAARRRGMIWMMVSFAFATYLMGAMMSLWVTNAQDLGHSAAVAAFAGAVIGPFKTIGRFAEMLISRDLYPRVTYLLCLVLMLAGFTVLLGAGATITGLVIAAALYGMGDGIKTIAGGTLPLALFGAKGYGARLGWISFILMGINASAPFAFAWLTQAYGGWWSFSAMASCVCIALATFTRIPDPRRQPHDQAQDRRLPESL